MSRVLTCAEKEELKWLQYSHERMLEFFKLHNENYFKRVQALMAAAQVGLLIVLMNYLPRASWWSLHPKASSWGLFLDNMPGRLPIVCITLIGILLAYTWYRLATKQIQSLEFCRRYLRNLEARFQSLGVPLDYFSMEAMIFGPLPASSKTVTTASIMEDEQCNIATFRWSRECYPQKHKDGDGGKLYAVGEVQGGMAPTERKVALGALIFWSLALGYFLGLFVCNAPGRVRSLVEFALVVKHLLISLLWFGA